MKECTYDKTVWQGYVNFLKESLGRALTEKEIKSAMNSYITGLQVEALVEKFK